MTTKKEYKKPAMRIFELKHRTHLLQTSVTGRNVKASMDGTFVEEDI